MNGIRRKLGVIASTLAVIGAGLTVAVTGLIVTAAPAGAVNASDDLTFRAAFLNPAVTQIDLTANISMTCVSGTWVRFGGVSPTNDVVIDGHGFALDATGCTAQAMFNSGSNLITFRDILLTGGNYSTSGSHGGGFLQNAAGSVTLINTEMEQNQVVLTTIPSIASSVNAGGMFVGGTATLINSTVANNTVRCAVTCGLASGGGIYATNVVAINSTISNNVANENGLGNSPDVGGGILITGGTLDLTYTTVADNQASDGANIRFASVGAVSSFASVIGNASGGGANCSGITTITSNGYNYEETSSGSCGFGGGTGDLVQGNDINLGSLASNGIFSANGITSTRMPNPGSPLIDQIPQANCDDDGAASIVPLVDQRGMNRPRGANCDIGAIEVPFGSFTSVTPARILDTRNGTGLSGAFTPQQTRSLQVTGVGSVPATASAVLLNVTATGATKAGWLTLFPADASLPTASNLNFSPGQTVPNLVVVKVGTGSIGIEDFIKINNTGGSAQAGTVHVVADVMGWYSSTQDAITAGFNGVTPTRVLDTRDGTGLSGVFAPQQTRSLTLGGVGEIPSNADSVVLNVTATAGTKDGWLTIFPADASLPTASNLNFVAGQTVANLVTVKLGTTGGDDNNIKISNTFGNAQAGTVHVVADLVGYYQQDIGGALTTISPIRIFDTRQGPGLVAGGATVTVDPGVAVAVPAVGSYTAVIVNVTATGSSKAGWLTVFPSDASLPTASNLNFVAGQTVPNLVKINVGVDGNFKINNTGGAASPGTVHIVVDIVGYYTPGVF